MPRRCHEPQAKSLEVIKGISQGLDFEFAAIAGSGVHFANGEAAPEAAPRRARYARREFADFHIHSFGTRFGQRAVGHAFE